MANAEVKDGLQNVVANLGTDRDKASFGAFTYTPTDLKNIDGIYRSSWLGRKVVDIPAADMTREWRKWQGVDAKQAMALEREEKRLELRAKITKALRWARLYGGAAIVLGTNETKPANPLADGEQLKYLHVLTREQISYTELDTDPLSPFYWWPKMWSVMGGAANSGVEIHPSRVIPVIGNERGSTDFSPDPWGDSIYDAMRDALVHSATASSAIASMLPEAKIDVITMPDLQNVLQTTDGESRLIKRFQTAALMKGINGMLLLGDGETYQQKTQAFTGLPEIHDRFLQAVAGAADIPMTRLLGQSPGGLQSTGESDLRNYYDGISSKQEDIMRPILDRIDALMVPAVIKAGAENVWWEFGELWQMSEKDQAAIFDTTASAIKKLAETGLVPDAALSDSVVALLDNEGSLPGLAKAVEEAGGIAGEADEAGNEAEEYL